MDERRRQLEELTSKPPSPASQYQISRDPTPSEVEEVIEEPEEDDPNPFFPFEAPVRQNLVSRSPVPQLPQEVLQRAATPIPQHNSLRPAPMPQESLAPNHDPRNSFNLFGPEVSQAEFQRLVIATAPVYASNQLTQLKEDILSLARQGKKVKVAVVWRQHQTERNAMPSPFELSRGDAVIDQDGELSVRYWKNLGNSDEIGGKTFKLPYQEPGVVEYSFIGFSVVRQMQESVAPQNNRSAEYPPQNTRLNQGAMHAYGTGTEEEEDDEKPKKMEPLYQGPGNTSFEVHDVPSIAVFLAELMNHNTAPAVISAMTIDEIDRQVGRSQVRFANSSIDAACAGLNGAILAFVDDGFRSPQIAKNLKNSINVYRLAIATAVSGARRVEQAILRNAVNIPKDDVMGRALAMARGRGRGRGRGGRGGGSVCSHCKKYGHTVDNCWQKQGQGNVSRGEAGKTTRQ